MRIYKEKIEVETIRKYIFSEENSKFVCCEFCFFLPSVTGHVHSEKKISLINAGDTLDVDSKKCAGRSTEDGKRKRRSNRNTNFLWMVKEQ